MSPPEAVHPGPGPRGLERHARHRGAAPPSTLGPVTRIEVRRGGAPPQLALIGLLGLIGLFEVLP